MERSASRFSLKIPQIAGLFIAVSLSGLFAISTNHASASLGLRHILLPLESLATLGGPVEGEIAYDSTHGRVTSLLNGEAIHFPPNLIGLQNLAYSSMSANTANASVPSSQEIRFQSGSQFRMGDRSIEKLSSDLTFHVADLHASTPLSEGWNYLYLTRNERSLGLNATSSYGVASAIRLRTAYAGSIYVTFSGSDPYVRPSRRIGTQYFYQTLVRDSYTPPAGPNSELLSLPATASSAKIYARSTDEAGCFSYSVSGSALAQEGPCASGLIELPRNASNEFSLNYTASGTHSVRIEIQGYNETADTLR